jgi:2-polyprenyl-3-methyl-5-hydroxy-6-metoxy-1,4-benzoquinol methylase
MRISSEAGRPDKVSLDLIEMAIRTVKPDLASLTEWYQNYAHSHKRRLAFDFDQVKKRMPQDSSLIEFGSIPPILTSALSRFGFKIVGIDIAPERFESCISSQGLNIMKVDIEVQELPFAADSFDGAIFNELFEHLRINPIMTMREVYRVLKPNGMLLLSTPNLTSLVGWINLIFKNRVQDVYREFMKLETIGHMGHIRVYTPTELCAFLQQVGFKPIEVVYRGDFQRQAAWKRYIANMILEVFPRFRPYFLVIASKSVQ